jgi:hypothetical protein
VLPRRWRLVALAFGRIVAKRLAPLFQATSHVGGVGVRCTLRASERPKAFLISHLEDEPKDLEEERTPNTIAFRIDVITPNVEVDRPALFLGQGNWENVRRMEIAATRFEFFDDGKNLEKETSADRFALVGPRMAN